jgi:2-amino-4-hydroxy-6-hydroxymethyldihydropteridine diphosphokinase
MTPAAVFLGLGSNMGDRRDNLRRAIDALNASAVTVIKTASIIETVPVGGPPQGLFLNTVVKVETALTPRALLKTIHRIEADLGRVRTVPNGPRPIDIDILLYGDIQVNEPDLIIPHPRMHQRPFVLVPLQELQLI